MRLIDADALKEAIENTNWYHISLKGYLEKGANSQIHRPLYIADDIYEALEVAPTVDAVPVVHGRCKFCDDYDIMAEIVCYLQNDNGGATDIPINYCPNCGAKMDGDGNG